MKTALLLICAAAITAAAMSEQLPAIDDVNNSPSTDTASGDAVVLEKATDVVPEKNDVTDAVVPDKHVVADAVVPPKQTEASKVEPELSQAHGRWYGRRRRRMKSWFRI